MKAFSKLFALCFFLCITVNTYAQNSISAVGLINFPDSVVINNSIDFDIVIKNDNPNAPFYGDIDIRFITDYMDSIGASDSSLFTINSDTIQPNKTDTVHVIGFSVTPSNFKTGDNTILIWPKSNMAGVGDSIKHTIKVLTSSAISQPNKKINTIIIFPNPTANSIHLLNNEGEENEIEKVRIYNLIGNVKLETLYKQNSPIDIHDLPQGIYMLEIELNTGELLVKKLIKN